MLSTNHFESHSPSASLSHDTLSKVYSLLPACASEQGNVIGLVSVYIHNYVCTKTIVIE